MKKRRGDTNVAAADSILHFGELDLVSRRVDRNM